MGLLPSAVGFLRSDVSATKQQQDERAIERCARLSGYDLRKIVVFSERTLEQVHRLRVVVDRTRVDAVIVPSVEHFDARSVPAELLEVAAVLTVSPRDAYARTLTERSSR
ncbi:hypothetical protein [Nocardia sp. NPDC059228]|uniref:hypothetical protein n=1 Tax=Nocardia sp. NPDC059228 TaxID=3346777 RepID=UPI00368D1A11